MLPLPPRCLQYNVGQVGFIMGYEQVSSCFPPAGCCSPGAAAAVDLCHCQQRCRCGCAGTIVHARLQALLCHHCNTTATPKTGTSTSGPGSRLCLQVDTLMLAMTDKVIHQLMAGRWVPACLLACLPACLRARPPARLSACLPACLPACRCGGGLQLILRVQALWQHPEHRRARDAGFTTGGTSACPWPLHPAGSLPAAAATAAAVLTLHGSLNAWPGLPCACPAPALQLC